MIAVRGWVILWSVKRLRRRALLPAAGIAVIAILLLTIGVASAMADFINADTGSDACLCGSDDSSTDFSDPDDPPSTGITFPNTGTGGLLGSGIGPGLTIAQLILLTAVAMIAAGSLGLVVERPVAVARERDRTNGSVPR